YSHTKMNNKAQLLSQVFVFMLAAVTLVMILLFGYKYIDSFMEQQEQIELIQFRDTLVDGVNSIRTRYGSVDKLTLSIPSEYNELCFVASEQPPNSKLQDDRPLLYNLWSADNNQTVFLLPLQELNIKLENLQVDNNYFCIPTQTKLDLRLESFGKKVKISLWE
ncbi:MAG: hypothetical protein AABX39_05300, partial [Nanoarchaeota archaeon]